MRDKDLRSDWVDIAPRWDGDKVIGAPYSVVREGSLYHITDNVNGKEGSLEIVSVKPALKTNVSLGNGRVAFQHVLSTLEPFEAKFNVSGDLNLRTRAFDDEGPIILDALTKDGVLTEKLSVVTDAKTLQERAVSGLIRIDPTIDVTVGASADDGWWRGTGFNNNDTSTYVGNISGACHAFHRFTGISGLSGATIDTMLFKPNAYSCSADLLTNVYCVDAESPAAPANYTQCDALSLTAGIAWDNIASGGGVKTSPELKTIGQELADDYDPTVIIIVHKDDGTSGSAAIRPYSYDYTDGSSAPDLYIEYTAGGGGGWGGEFCGVAAAEFCGVTPAEIDGV